jgi:REP element-mobilizing transposase RayT
MPQSLSNIILHVVFSTKDRAPMIREEVQPRLHAYLATLARKGESECFRVGGVTDHVHLAVRLARTETVADLVREVKSVSSAWMKQFEPEFAWQRGYAAISVDPHRLPSLRHYIDTQAEHHRKVDFQQEYRSLLREFGIEFDEKFVWD